MYTQFDMTKAKVIKASSAYGVEGELQRYARQGLEVVEITLKDYMWVVMAPLKEKRDGLSPHTYKEG